MNWESFVIGLVVGLWVCGNLWGIYYVLSPTHAPNRVFEDDDMKSTHVSISLWSSETPDEMKK